MTQSADQRNHIASHQPETPTSNDAASQIGALEAERRRIESALEAGPLTALHTATTTVEWIDHLMAVNPREARIELRRLYTALATMTRDIRATLFAADPAFLASLDLRDALTALIADAERHGAPPVELRYAVAETLPEPIAAFVYMVTREALDNIRRHSKASACQVDVRVLEASAKSDANTLGEPRATRNRELRLIVRDNGVGFDTAQVLTTYPHGQAAGLLQIYERARALRAECSVHARPGQGTVIEARIRL